MLADDVPVISAFVLHPRRDRPLRTQNRFGLTGSGSTLGGLHLNDQPQGPTPIGVEFNVLNFTGYQ